MLLGAFAAFAAASTFSKPYLGLHGLHGRGLEHTFAWSSGDHRISLSYSAAHPPDVHILKIDEEDDVLGLICVRDTVYLRLRAESTLASVLGPESLITGGADWNCTEGHGLGNGAHAPIMREVVAVLSVVTEGDETLLGLRTEEANHLHFFFDLDLNFQTNVLQDATPPKRPSARGQPTSTEASRGSQEARSLGNIKTIPPRRTRW